MVKKIFILVIFSIFLLSCNNDNEQKVLHTYLSGVVPSLDPMFVTDRYSHTVTRQVYEGLYQYHYLKQPYSLEPVIAEGMPKVSKDGRTYSINIKKGIFFIDDDCFEQNNGKGRELTADDVIYSFDRVMKSPTTKGILFADLMRKTVKQIIKKDTYSIIFKLNHRTPFFPDMLTRPNGFIVAKEAVKFYGKDFCKHPVGTGPFKLDEYGMNDKIILVKNKKYNSTLYPNEGAFNDEAKGLLKAKGHALPFLDKVVIYILPDEEPRWMNFLKGVIDIVVPDKDTYYNAFPVAGELAPKLASLNIRVIKMLKLETNFFIFNLRKGIFTNNKKLRQAVSLAFDTEKYNALFRNNQVVLANWLLPPNTFGYEADARNPYIGKNLKKAKDLLKQASFNMKNAPKLKVLVRDSLAGKQIGKFFQTEMKEIGIKVELIQKKFSEIIKQLPTWKAYDIAFLRWRIDFPIVEDPLRLLYSEAASPGPNRSGYINKKYDKLYNKISNLPEGLEKFQLIKKARKIAREDVPLVPLFHPMLITLHHNYVKNYKPHLLVGDMFKYIDIDLKERKRILKKIK